MDDLLRRAAFMVEIAHAKSQLGCGRLGKTAMQKLLFFAQEFSRIPLGYCFQLYTYGPYDPRVMADLDYCASVELLRVEFDPNSGYSILPGPKADAVITQRTQLQREFPGAIDRLLSEFGRDSARELELCATLVFAESVDPGPDISDLSRQVRVIKPKYSDHEIDVQISRLTSLGLLRA